VTPVERGADVRDFFHNVGELAQRQSRRHRKTTARRRASRRNAPPPDPTRTAQINGKAERFIQTLLAEWARIAVYRNSTHRERALDPWNDYYNNRGPHGALGQRRPTLNQLTNILGKSQEHSHIVLFRSFR
jgi:transposase InsO family protein